MAITNAGCADTASADTALAVVRRAMARRRRHGGADLVLRAAKIDVPADQAHVRIVKNTANSQSTYTIEAVNGTRLATFTGITDFTADGGQGATDYDMLYI